ncbi:MAG: group III truncated hemoglobin [Litorimonas sp.]
MPNSAIFTEADIKRFVESFYTAIRQDPILAPIFATKTSHDAWDKHIEHITDFWSSVLLKTQRFTGNPLQKHIGVSGITPAHFTHWLSLFHTIAKKKLTPEQADIIHKMAQRIAQSLQMGLAFHYETSGQTEHSFTEFGIKAKL